MRLRILLADDHEIVRRGLRALLEKHEGWEVCGEAKTGHEAVNKNQRSKTGYPGIRYQHAGPERITLSADPTGSAQPIRESGGKRYAVFNTDRFTRALTSVAAVHDRRLGRRVGGHRPPLQLFCGINRDNATG